MYMTSVVLPTRKDLLNELYDSALITSGVIVLSMVSKKLMGDRFVAANDLKEALKLTVGITVANMLVKWAQENKYIPTEPFKSS